MLLPQFERLATTAARRLEQFGVDPSQTGHGALDLGTRVAEAAAQASAGNQARTQTENIGRALRSEAINVGRGYPGQIRPTWQAPARPATRLPTPAWRRRLSGAKTMGTGQGWQGLGNSAIGQWGNILNAGFSNQMDRTTPTRSRRPAGAACSAPSPAPSWAGQRGAAIGGLGSLFSEEGGVIPDPRQMFQDGGMPIPEEASPSGGAIPDDIPAEIDGQAPAQLNAGEFIVPEDVVKWLGEKGMQQIILKARKEMTGANGERPAQPEMGPPPIPPEGAGAIPTPPGRGN